MTTNDPVNVLSVDVEEYFHVEAFSGCVSPADWESYPSRVEAHTQKTLDLFAKHGVRATFFVLGWVARRFPRLAPQIGEAGHEIGCHGFAHKNIGRQTPEEFRTDVRTARELLRKQTGEPVLSYRAPSFSITPQTAWAMDILSEEGFLYDSSLFPVRRTGRGFPEAPRFPHRHGRTGLFEFPPSTRRIGDLTIGIAGGGYLRFAPYPFTQKALRRINRVEKQPGMVYFHPWELDPDHPRIRAKLSSRIKHYGLLSGMERKIDRLLQDFKFTTLKDACEELGKANREAQK
jgi:polysaccharide deacetylase family protein (PEP-CTERM system associated)